MTRTEIKRLEKDLEEAKAQDLKSEMDEIQSWIKETLNK